MNNKLIESLTKHINKIHEIDYMGDFTFGRESDKKVINDIPAKEKMHWATDYNLQSNTGWKDYEPGDFSMFKGMLSTKWSTLKFPCTIDFGLIDPETLNFVNVQITCKNEEGPVEIALTTSKASIKKGPNGNVKVNRQDKTVKTHTTPDRMSKMLISSFQNLRNRKWIPYKNPDEEKMARDIIAKKEQGKGYRY